MAVVNLSNRGNSQPVPSGYQCGNCMRMIGAMEQPYQWGEGVVCPECCASLQAATYQAQPAPRRKGQSHNSTAIIGLVLAFIIPIAGLIVSAVALSGMNRSRNNEGKGMAQAGLVLSIVFLFLNIVIGVILAIVLLSAPARVVPAPEVSKPRAPSGNTSIFSE